MPLSFISLTHSIQAQQRTIRDYLKAAESRIQTNQEKIDEENRRLAEMTDGSHARRQQEYEEAANNAKEAAQELEQHNAGEAALQSDCREAEQEENNANTEYMSKKRELEQAENRLHSLRQEDGQRRTGFPEKMPSLLRAIESERSFRERPVGPLGHYITLLKPKWASVLEGSLNTTLSSFVVTSKADQMILSGLMRKTNW